MNYSVKCPYDSLMSAISHVSRCSSVSRKVMPYADAQSHMTSQSVEPSIRQLVLGTTGW